MIITIARECGCDGDKIGEKLAEHFSIPFYNKKKIQEIAEKSEVSEKFPTFSERRRQAIFWQQSRWIRTVT